MKCLNTIHKCDLLIARLATLRIFLRAFVSERFGSSTPEVSRQEPGLTAALIGDGCAVILFSHLNRLAVYLLRRRTSNV